MRTISPGVRSALGTSSASSTIVVDRAEVVLEPVARQRVGELGERLEPGQRMVLELVADEVAAAAEAVRDDGRVEVDHVMGSRGHDHRWWHVAVRRRRRGGSRRAIALDAVSEPLPVTVVIPAYNRPAMVQRAVRSALDQRPRPPAEVLVVDDCSSDDTAAAASAAGATVIRHDVNRGGAAARNTAIRAAGHDWIAFLDSDDELLPHHLAALWPHRDGHVILGSSAIACAPDPADDSLIGRAGRRPEVLKRPSSVLRHGNVLVTSSVIVRREVAIAAGLFTEGMKRSADLDLWLRILERGTGYVDPNVTVRYHQHPDQVTRRPEQDVRRVRSHRRRLSRTRRALPRRQRTGGGDGCCGTGCASISAAGTGRRR